MLKKGSWKVMSISAWIPRRKRFTFFVWVWTYIVRYHFIRFFYNRATYRFSNGEEDFIVTLSPSYGEVKIQVTQRASNQLISIMDLKRVDKFEITADKKDLSSVLLMLLNDDFITQTIEIDFKPKFKLIFREHYTR